ncbi:coiled-coil domain-containing protein 171-like isoform X2 [Acanthaster planci]|uniref:Coiled-coil domain-containing protein 171-like isoform X2 n=1 Tax=Acanthaster planci TaxID=133434 RepID=A0A8B7ZI51_ACAPL|nr:coiled-coil domain-containing protein 171-like isoform X2 [Acanthaster planci]
MHPIKSSTTTYNHDTMATKSPQGTSVMTGEMSARESDVRRKSSPFLDDSEAAEELRQLRLKIARLQDENQSEIDMNNELRKRVTQLENEKLKLTASSNEEVNQLEAQVARLRAQFERGEAARQQLEYEIAVAKRGISQEKSLAGEREDSLNAILETHKEKISELTSKVQDLQSSLVSQRRFADETDVKLRTSLEEKERELQAARAEQDVIRSEKEQLEQVFHEQENIYAETQEKVNDLKTERDTQTNTVRQQLRELQYAAEREDRLKKEVEVTIGRIKTLEETIEAERAAHLESKFNSELVQLQVRDLKGALDVEKSAHAEVEHNAEIMTKQLRDLEVRLEEERSSASNAKHQAESFSRENELLKQQLGAETNSKTSIITNMSAQLEIHQKNFDELKQELSKAKKRQIYLEETYGGSMQELELLLHNFQLNGDKITSKKLAKGKKGDAKNKENLSPMLVLETLRHTLTDYQKRLDTTSQELTKMKSRSEKMAAECEKYREVTWTRSQTMQDLQKKFSSSYKEVEQLRHQLSESESQVTSLKMELQQATHRGEMEGTKAADRMEEFERRLKENQDEEEKRRIYLHSLYQRIMAGRVVLDPKEPVLSSFAWDELSIAVQDQVVGLMTGLTRANEKVAHLETVIHNKDELLREVQHAHEESLERLSVKGKEREKEWRRQRSQLEEQFSQQLADLHIKSQKTQNLADQAWEKARLTGAVKQGLEAECSQLGDQLTQATRERSGLLIGCCLLAGALLPMFSRVNQLAAQRTSLEEQIHSLETMRQQARELANTLSMEEADLGKDLRDISQSARNPVMLFRKAVIVVLAANRLNHLGLRSCGIFTAVDNPSGIHSVPVCSGNIKPSQRPFMGLKSSPDKQTQRSNVQSQIPDWFTSSALLTTVVDSCMELQELLTDKEQLNGSQPQTINNTAKSCFVRLMSKLTPIFEASCPHPSRRSYGKRDKGMLIRLLGYGLSQGMAHSSPAGKTHMASSQEIMACLQRNIINFTQRLHTAEVERRSLRVETAKLRQDNEELKMEKERAKDMENEITQLRDIRHNMVMKEKFDSVCQELSKALSREQQAQELLNEQSRQLEELGMRLNMYTTEELEKDATITEAVKGLSEAKMELRRKEQSIHQLSKKLSLLEEEKKSLQGSVQDVQEVLRSSNKEKDKLAGYLQAVQGAVEDIKRHLVSRADNRSVDAALRQVLIHPEKRGLDGISAEVIAIKSLVAAFVDTVQTSLSRLVALETEITSHKQHTATLKEELNAACLRAYPDDGEQVRDDFMGQGSSRIPERSFGRSRPLYETDRSYKEQFVPLREEPDFSMMTQEGASGMKTSLYTPQTPLATSTRRKTPSKARNFNHH